MSTTDLDRTTLDGKDREQLHAIAGAMGVKAPTRMRKAELIDAIMAAANGDAAPGNGDGESSRRTVRSARASQLESESIEALAAEEDAIASGGDEAEVEPRPVRRGSGSSGDRASPLLRALRTAVETASDSSDKSSGGGSTKTANVDIDPEDVRESYGDGNQTRNRRRRRRGRGGQDNEPRREQEPVGDPVPVQGLLELRDEGYGFLRTRGTSRAQPTCTCPRRRYDASVFARATSSKASRDRKPATRSTPRCCASTPSTRCHPEDAKARPALRRPHAAVPRREPPSRDGRQPGRGDRSHHRPDLADREGTARPDRVAAEGGQDDDPEADRVLDRAQQPRGAPHGRCSSTSDPKRSPT